MQKITNLLLFITAFLFISCAKYQPPKTYDVVKDMTYDKTFEEVWNAAIEWFALNGTPIKNMDKSSGFISTEYSLSTGQLNCLDCGKSGHALLAVQRLEDPRGNFNLLIKKLSDGKTKVTVNCFFKATSNVYYEGRVTSSNVIDCNSTGLLEKEIIDYLGNH